MKNFVKSLIGLAVIAVGSAHADMLFDNTSGTATGPWGYFNSPAAWGDEVTLAGSAELTSFSFDIYDVSGGFDNGTLTLAVYNVDPGTDGIFQTSDDMIGSLIGSFAQSAVVASNSRYTISGFSFSVPSNFIYTVTNAGDLSYTLEATLDPATIGTSSNSNLWSSFSGDLPVGATSNATWASNYGNNQVIFEGVAAVPEPSAVYFLSGTAGLALMLRLRRFRS